MHAAQYEDGDMMGLLVELGADVNKADNDGETGAWEEGDGGTGRGARAADTEALRSTHGVSFDRRQGLGAAAGGAGR